MSVEPLEEDRTGLDLDGGGTNWLPLQDFAHSAKVFFRPLFFFEGGSEPCVGWMQPTHGVCALKDGKIHMEAAHAA